jgi:uncharacterized SAM-binding protein YcdF (DUF218 family)
MNEPRRNNGFMGNLILLVVVVILALNPQWYLPHVGQWLVAPSTEDDNAPNGAVVVLGGGAQQRLLHGIALREGDEERELWYTGNMIPERTRTFIDPPYAREYAIGRGVPADKVRLLQSTSTWEDALAVKEAVAETGVEHLVVVTNYFHSRRAMCVLRHHLAEENVTLIYSAPGGDDFDASRWWESEQDLVDVAEEWVKVFYYWRSYGLAPWTC